MIRLRLQTKHELKYNKDWTSRVHLLKPPPLSNHLQKAIADRKFHEYVFLPKGGPMNGHLS